MGDGKLRCCGSPLFLKRIYGVGYNITVEKESVTDFDSKGAMDKITEYVPGSKLLTNVGTELSAQLPFTGSSGFQPLFEYLDDNMVTMGIKSYGMSVTTLEEVFLKVASGTSTIATAVTAMGGEAAEGVGGAGESKDGKKYQPVSAGDNDVGVLVVGSEVREESALGADKPLGDEHRDPESRQTKADTYELDESAKIGEARPLEMFIQHMKALLTKRFLYFRRDTKAWGFQFMLPIIFVLAGCLIMHYNVWAPDQPSIVLSPTDYNTAISSDFLPLPYSAADSVCPVKSDCNTSRYEISGQDYVMNPVFNSASFPMEPQYDAVSVYNISFMLLKDREEYRASRFGAITFTEVLFNDSGVNSGNFQSVKYVVHGNFTGAKNHTFSC
jgi:ATP-binding cassette, subfamily A (ABC1), member 3